MTNAISGFSTPATEKTTTPAKGFSGGDFDTFLRMLTTQLKNQDPMNPLDSSEFAVQLATFSSVEQQAHTNALLQRISDHIGGPQIGQAVGWIGKQVLTTAPVHFDGSPVTLDLQPSASADQAILVTYDQYGREILREDVGTGSGQADWVGRDVNGQRLGNGHYSFKLESYRADELIDHSDVPSYSTVQEIVTRNGRIDLVLNSGDSVTVADVTGIR